MSDPKNFEFTDRLSYEMPDAPDCLMVPEEQWDQIQSNLKAAHPFLDNCLWIVAGIAGGGAISCWCTLGSFTVDTADWIKHLFVTASFVLPAIAVITAFAAYKFGSETTSKEVASQMEVLKKGFRKLKTEIN